MLDNCKQRRKSSAGDESAVENSEDAVKQVDRALLEANTAVNSAQDALQSVTSLPSAHPPHPVVSLLKKMASLVLRALIIFTLVYALSNRSLWMRWTASIVFPVLIGVYSYEKGSLSLSGAFAAAFVGFGTFLAGFRAAAILLSFFASSSIWTKFGEKKKSAVAADHKKGGQRNWIQVFSNGFFATIFCLIYAYLTRMQDLPLSTKSVSSLCVFFFGCVLGNYSCTSGDTWASELGILATSPARLITTLKPVPRGTNGGVTMLGLFASLSGGLFVGMAAFISTFIISIGSPLNQVAAAEWPLIILGMTGGFFGSIVDSILGATLQFSGYDRRTRKVVNQPNLSDPDAVYKLNGRNILTNNQVNLISSLVMALVIGKLTVVVYG